jgi:hypothetical protein
VFKAIVAGDRRKFVAQSNDAPTGGGARDLRFSPYDKFALVFERMLPQKDEHGVCRGQFHWEENGQEKVGDAYFHPPTNARPNEGRLANVDKYLPKHSLPPEGQDDVILLILQENDGSVWPYFTTVESLKSDNWQVNLRDKILGCCEAKRPRHVTMSGFVDFETGEEFCNGG